MWGAQPGLALCEVPAVSVRNLGGGSVSGERRSCLGASVSSSSAPFLTLQSLLWLVSEMPRLVLTLEGGRGEENRRPQNAAERSLERRRLLADSPAHLRRHE